MRDVRTVLSLPSLVLRLKHAYKFTKVTSAPTEDLIVVEQAVVLADGFAHRIQSLGGDSSHYCCFVAELETTVAAEVALALPTPW